MKLALFLSVAIAIVLCTLLGLGNWLLPRLGVDRVAQGVIPAAVSGVLIVTLYNRMFNSARS